MTNWRMSEIRENWQELNAFQRSAKSNNYKHFTKCLKQRIGRGGREPKKHVLGGQKTRFGLSIPVSLNEFINKFNVFMKDLNSGKQALTDKVNIF